MKKDTIELVVLSIIYSLILGFFGLCLWGMSKESEKEAEFERACRARGGIVKHPNHHLCVKDDTIPVY